ncbi:MAG: type II toxin-antitoxin system HicB family antitoxin [Bacillota bacterium]
MALQKFMAIMEWDEEGKGYVVTVPSLPGCFTQGDTKEEALERVKEAIQGYLETLKQEGLPLPGNVEFAEIQVEVAS